RRRYRRRYAMRREQRLRRGIARPAGGPRGVLPGIRPLCAASLLQRWGKSVSLFGGVENRRGAPIFVGDSAELRGLRFFARAGLSGSNNRNWETTHDGRKKSECSRRVLEPCPQEQNAGDGVFGEWRQAAGHHHLV